MNISGIRDIEEIKKAIHEKHIYYFSKIIKIDYEYTRPIKLVLSRKIITTKCK